MYIKILIFIIRNIVIVVDIFIIIGMFVFMEVVVFVDWGEEVGVIICNGMVFCGIGIFDFKIKILFLV